MSRFIMFFLAMLGLAIFSVSLSAEDMKWPCEITLKGTGGSWNRFDLCDDEYSFFTAAQSKKRCDAVAKNYLEKKITYERSIGRFSMQRKYKCYLDIDDVETTFWGI